MQAAEPILAVVPDVVEEDERTVGPAGEDRLIEVERVDDRVDVRGPQRRIVVSVARLLRATMPPQVEYDQPMILGQARAQLPAPLQATLRRAVDEHDRTTLRVPRLDNVELDAATACDSMFLHHLRPLLSTADEARTASRFRRPP